MVSSVISWPIGAATKLNAIIKIRKYKRFYKGYHFILMAMEVHGTPGCDMDHFIRECVCLFHNKQSGGHLFLSFCTQFGKHHANIALQHVLASAMERKIALVGDACSRPPIIIQSHDLHTCNIRGAMGEITSYHERDFFIFFPVPMGCVSFGISLNFLFLSPLWWFQPSIFYRKKIKMPLWLIVV